MSALSQAKDARLAPDDPRHGTANGYKNRGCRCDSCREAWRVCFIAYRRRRGVLLREDYDRELREHGIVRYKRYGCRCDVCRAASTDLNRVEATNAA